MNNQATYTGDVIAFILVWVIIVLPIVAFVFRKTATGQNTATGPQTARDDRKMDAILKIEAYKGDPERHGNRHRVKSLARTYDKVLYDELCREDEERRLAFEARRDAQWAELKARGLV
jgi:hypothetical protein